MRKTLFIAGLLGFTLPCLAQQHALSSVPLLDCKGLPCVDAMIAGGKHVRLLIDTGNVASTIDHQVAVQNNLQLQPVTRHDGTVVPDMERATLPEVKLGDASLGDVKVLAMDISGYVQKGQMPPADGSLAYTAFKDRLVELDFKHHQLRFSAPLTTGASCPGNCGTIDYITFGRQGPPIVVATGFTLNGKPITAQVDTQYSGTMLIYPTSTDKLGLHPPESSSQKRMFPFTDGGVEMITGQAKSEGFDDVTLAQDPAVYFATPEVHAPDGLFDGTVGCELFSNFTLVLDFHDKWISIRM